MLVSTTTTFLYAGQQKFYTAPFPFLPPPPQASSSTQLASIMSAAGNAEVSPNWGVDANVSPMLSFLEEETSPNQAHHHTLFCFQFAGFAEFLCARFSCSRRSWTC